MRKFNAALIIIILLTLSPNSAFGKDKVVKDKKHMLVDQIIDAVESAKPDEKERELIKKKRHERMEHIVDVFGEKTNMSESGRTMLKEKLSENKKHKEMPPAIKERFDKVFADHKSFSRDLCFQVLSDHMDENDLRTVLKFLKSKTGKKLVKESPDMVAQSIALYIEHYAADIVEACKDLRQSMPLPMMPPGVPYGGDSEKRKEMMEKLKQMMKKIPHPKQAPSGPNKDET